MSAKDSWCIDSGPWSLRHWWALPCPVRSLLCSWEKSLAGTQPECLPDTDQSSLGDLYGQNGLSAAAVNILYAATGEQLASRHHAALFGLLAVSRTGCWRCRTIAFVRTCLVATKPQRTHLSPGPPCAARAETTPPHVHSFVASCGWRRRA